MRSLIKKYFDWTPRDVAQWEALRRKGVWRFTLWYGLLSGSLFFIIPGGWMLAAWIKEALSGQAASLGYLALQLLVVAVVCLAAGLINALITWVMEEKIYHKKYKC